MERLSSRRNKDYGKESVIKLRLRNIISFQRMRTRESLPISQQLGG